MNLQYRRNLYTSYLQLGATTLYGFVGPSIAVRIWGSDIYAVWLLLTSYLSYLYLSGAMGMDNAAYVLMGRCQGRAGKVRVFRQTFLVLTGSALLFAGIALAASVFHPDWVLAIGEIPASIEDTTRKVVNTLLVLFLINLPFFASSGALVGVGQQHWKSILEAAGSLLSLLSIVVCWRAGWDIQVFAWMVASSQILVSAVRMAILGRSLGDLPPEVPDDPRVGLPDVLRCGLASLGVSVASMGIQMSEIVSVGKLFPLAVVAGYLPLSRLANMGFSMCMNMNNALAGPVSHAFRNGEDVGRIVVRFERRSMILGTVVAVGMVLFSAPFMDVWLGPGLHPGAWVSLGLAGYGVLYLRTNLYSVVLNACNRVESMALVIGFELVAKVVAIVALHGILGVAAIPLAGVVSSLVVPNIVLPRLLPREVSRLLDPSRIWRMMAPPLAGMALAGGIASLGSPLPRWGLAAALMAATFLWAWIQWRRVNDEGA